VFPQLKAERIGYAWSAPFVDYNCPFGARPDSWDRRTVENRLNLLLQNRIHERPNLLFKNQGAALICRELNALEGNGFHWKTTMKVMMNKALKINAAEKTA
jgi:hypothetical protein